MANLPDPKVTMRNRAKLILDAILVGRLTSMEQVAPLYGISEATAQANLKVAIRAACWKSLPGTATDWLLEASRTKSGRIEALRYLVEHRDAIRQAREALILAENQKAERKQAALDKLAPLTPADLEAISRACRPMIVPDARNAMKAFGDWADFDAEAAPQIMLSILPKIHVRQLLLNGRTLNRLRAWMHQQGRCLAGDEQWNPDMHKNAKVRQAISLLERIGYTVSRKEQNE